MVEQDGYSRTKAYAWSVFALTAGLHLFDFLDRQIIASMLPFLKTEWALSDKQLGGLMSVVSLTAGLLALPVGFLADRWSRAKAVAAMALVWSLATIACALAADYSQLLALRGLVGVGEAGYGAVGSAILAGLFPRSMRASILSAFAANAAIGSFFGILLGGALASAFGWRSAFGFVGIPGLFLAFLYLFVREGDSTTGNAQISAIERQPFIWRHLLPKLFNRPTGLLIYFGSSIQLFVLATFHSWLPSYFVRVYGLTAPQAGARAAVVLLLGAVAAIAWGMLADKAGKRDPGNKLLVMAGMSFAGVVTLSIAFWLFSPGPMQYALIVLSGAFMTGTLGTAAAVALSVAHPDLKATTVAFGTLVQSVVGFAGGPFIAGALSDAYGLTKALSIIPFLSLIAVAIFLALRPQYKRDLGQSDYAVPEYATAH